MRARFLILVGGLVALSAVIGCKSENSLGGDCVLVKKGPDGGTAVSILESEINAGLQKDFVSFGSIECEDFVCTRDPGFPRADGGAAAKAHGYCSKPCATNDACKTGDETIDKDPKKKLTCRALLLDEQTLGQICQQNPADCQTYFGGTSSPFFCARPLTATDGG